MLLKHGPDANVQDKDDRTALYLAAQSGSPENLGMLLKHGTDVNVQDKDDQIPLHLGILGEHKYWVTS